MNRYIIIGDLFHLLAIVYLVWSIFKSRSCRGVSVKSQLLILLICITRYADIFTNFNSEYRTIFKGVFISNALITLFMICYCYKKTHDHQNDTFWNSFLFSIATLLAIRYSYDISSALETLWAFSIFLETFALIPQFYMIYKSEEMKFNVSFYIGLLITYRFFYIMNWIYKYQEYEAYDVISVASGTTQTVINMVLFCIFLFKGYAKNSKNNNFPVDVIKNNIYTICDATLASTKNQPFTIISPDVKMDVGPKVNYDNESHLKFYEQLLDNDQPLHYSDTNGAQRNSEHTKANCDKLDVSSENLPKINCINESHIFDSEDFTKLISK